MTDWSSDFVGNDDFFTPVLFTPVGGSARTIRGLFEHPDFNPILAGGLKVESAQPKLTCATADVMDVTHGATLELPAPPLSTSGKKLYYVVHISDDGTGLTELDLSETPDGG